LPALEHAAERGAQARDRARALGGGRGHRRQLVERLAARDPIFRGDLDARIFRHHDLAALLVLAGRDLDGVLARLDAQGAATQADPTAAEAEAAAAGLAGLSAAGATLALARDQRARAKVPHHTVQAGLAPAVQLAHGLAVLVRDRDADALFGLVLQGV